MNKETRISLAGPALMAAITVAIGNTAIGSDTVEPKDQALLEFLGSFEESDEDWLAVTIEEMTQEDAQASGKDGERVEAANDEN
jgi:hypothetical protein